MILIPCIHCGLRNASEFKYLGEVVARPDPNAAEPAEWRRYLYAKSNPAGWITERWVHQTGCRRFFVVERHTVTNAIRAAGPPGQNPEALGTESP